MGWQVPLSNQLELQLGAPLLVSQHATHMAPHGPRHFVECRCACAFNQIQVQVFSHFFAVIVPYSQPSEIESHISDTTTEKGGRAKARPIAIKR